MSINSSCNGSFFTANLQCTLHWTTSWRPSSLPSFFTGERGRELGLLSFFLLMLEEIYLLKCGAVCLFAASSQIQMGDLFFLGHQRIYLSPNAASMHLCLNFADAFMWANAESMSLIVELACLLLSSQNQCKTHLETISQIQLSTPNSGC
jgi:hypothetical protein